MSNRPSYPLTVAMSSVTYTHARIHRCESHSTRATPCRCSGRSIDRPGIGIAILNVVRARSSYA